MTTETATAVVDAGGDKAKKEKKLPSASLSQLYQFCSWGEVCTWIQHVPWSVARSISLLSHTGAPARIPCFSWAFSSSVSLPLWQLVWETR